MLTDVDILWSYIVEEIGVMVPGENHKCFHWLSSSNEITSFLHIFWNAVICICNCTVGIELMLTIGSHWKKVSTEDGNHCQTSVILINTC